MQSVAYAQCAIETKLPAGFALLLGTETPEQRCQKEGS